MKLNLGIIASTFLVSTAIVLADEIGGAVSYGNLLTGAIQEKQDVKLKKLPEYKAIKSFLSKNKCAGFKYKGYIVGSENDKYFYLVASKGGNVIIGRHFKAPMVGGAIAVERLESSTNGCLDLGNPEAKNTAAMFATHLKPTPNEFHVLQSNLHAIALYIGTSNGMYSIENGVIQLPEAE